MNTEERLIVFTDAGGHERTVVPAWGKRRVASIAVSFASPPELQQVQRVVRALEDGLAGASVAIAPAESDDDFMARIAAEIVPEDAKDIRILTRSEHAAELAKRAAAAEKSRRLQPPALEPDQPVRKARKRP